MKELRFKLALLLILSMLCMTLIPATGLAGGPLFEVTGLQDVDYKKGDGAVLIAPNVVIDHGGAYSNGFVRFSIANGTAGETLSVTQSVYPLVDAGKVSVVTSAVYLGNGSVAAQIGVVNAGYNGKNGKPLQIDFSTPIHNGDFEDDSTMAGWTAENVLVTLGNLASKTKGNPVSSTGTGPYTITKSGPGGYSYTSDNPYTYEGMERAPSGTPTFTSGIIQENGNNVLRLQSSGTVVSSGGSQPYGSMFGPEAISEPFEAKAGDSLAFNWKAANGGDDYEIYGFLIKINTPAPDTTTEILYSRGKNQGWTTAKGEIPADGTYAFRFVSGSFDASGGLALGASLYIDDIRIGKAAPVVTDEMVTQLAQQLHYEATSFTGLAPTTRTVTVLAQNTNNEKADSSLTINLSWSPWAQNATHSVKSFEALSGNLSATDPNGDTISYYIASQPSNGSVTQTVYGEAAFVYTSNAGYVGSDSFTFVANDGTWDSEPGTVTINVLPSDNADLTALSLSSGSLTPAFATSTTAYKSTVYDSSVTVTATVYNPYATIKVKDVTTASATASASLPLILGKNTIPVEVTAQDGTTTKTYTIEITREDPPVVIPPDNAVRLVVDGVIQEPTATAKKDTIGKQSATIVTVDNDKVIAKVEKENTKVLTIPVPGNSETTVSDLNGKLVKALENKDTVIEIRTDKGSYSLPASEIKIGSLSGQFATTELDKIKLSIQIGLSQSETSISIQKSADQEGLQLVVPPMDFKVTASYGGKTVELERFSSYIERTIAIPDGVDPSKVTTAVVRNADGSLTHVPTKVIKQDGKYYAVINSLTNSSYAVVYSPESFADVETHWSKQDVNDMASRQVVQGVTDQSFQPDRAITRAEFIAIVVRALGLRAGMGSALPKDIVAADWYAGSVQTGLEYSLISGYEDGTFRPNQTITRAEAAVIVSRAMKLPKLTNGWTDAQTIAALAPFVDGVEIPAWAKSEMAAAAKVGILQGDSGYIRPLDDVTRAQTAAMLRRLLQKAELI
ncbi:S-layer homology domain-containing protein [Paenibacillus koleovorans]|uniref:S-layer homology domain-containing protein n=1 Tax=Paenibacillus koleovorans TaxID=121608 RepID=UPI000FD86EE3|nr:S-layer homology domain-containing protein [Paenibacillus koleovorans]